MATAEVISLHALYEQDSLARLKLRGRILARTQSELGGRLVHTAALAEDFQATGAHPSDTEDVINMTLAVGGSEVAVIFVEQPSGGFKLSFRSRTPRVDCNELAKRFGGGGHKGAGTCLVLSSTADDEIAFMIETLKANG